MEEVLPLIGWKQKFCSRGFFWPSYAGKLQNCLGTVMLDVLGEQINGQHAGETVRHVTDERVA